MDDERKKQLMIRMESIIGNQCYNGNTQNWGPHGVFEGEGREFRYPVTFDLAGKKDKCKKVDGKMPLNQVRQGYYAFGANHLNIFYALEKVIKVLEREYGLK